MPRKSPEHALQAAIFVWAAHARATMPELDAMYAIINEGKRGRRQNPKTGAWYSTEGQRYKKQGMKAGTPDVCLPAPRGGYGALYVELKAPGNRSTKKQRERQELLRMCGNMVVEIDNFDEATDTITRYLAGEFARPDENTYCSKKHTMTCS